MLVRPSVSSADEGLVKACIEEAVAWVTPRLRDDADDESPQVMSIITALSEFYLFLRSTEEIDGYDTYSVGDLTFRRNCERELRAAKEKRDTAIADACVILKDGGFYCYGT